MTCLFYEITKSALMQHFKDCGRDWTEHTTEQVKYKENMEENIRSLTEAAF